MRTKTINRNWKRFQEILKRDGWKCYSLSNGFTAEPVSKEHVKNDLENCRWVKMRQRGDMVSVSVHSNLWYELLLEENDG